MEPTQKQNFRSVERWNSVPVPERVAERAYTRVDKQDDGCWTSQYSIGSHGYSQIGWQDKGSRHVVLGHRAAWTYVNGQVPLGMTIDHLCKRRRCVNPVHLRLLPNYENARRTSGSDWPLGFCKHGHSPTELYRVTNAKNASGYSLHCLPCTQASRIKHQEKKKMERAKLSGPSA